mgnify:CR=1 FL=1
MDWNAVVANNATSSFLCSREVYRQWMEAHGAVWESGREENERIVATLEETFPHRGRGVLPEPAEAEHHEATRRRVRRAVERGLAAGELLGVDLGGTKTEAIGLASTSLVAPRRLVPTPRDYTATRELLAERPAATAGVSQPTC